MEEKRAVVLSGGGAKGGYQIGVWKALRELDFQPDIVMGTSVGALNGALMALGKYEEALAVWENMSMDRVFSRFVEESEKEGSTFLSSSLKTTGLIKELIFQKGADYQPLQDLVKGLMEEEKLRSSPIEFGLVTTRLNKSAEGAALYIEDIPQGEAADYVIASAACFPFMKSYSIGGNKYIDGGYTDNIPIDMALKKGATEIVVVNIGGNMARQKQVPPNEARFHYIHNHHAFSDKSPASTIHFNRERSLSHIQQGYLDTLKAFGKLEGYAYTFEKGEIFKTESIDYRCSQLFEQIFSGLPNASRWEKTAQKHVLNHLRGFSEKPFMYNAGILSCVESAAALFDLDFLTRYTLESMTREILKRYHLAQEKETKEMQKKLLALFRRRAGTETVTTALSAFDKQFAAAYMARLLVSETLNYSQKRQLWMLGALLPECFCAAIFIAASLLQENPKENEMP